MTKNKKNNKWFNRHISDKYVLQSKRMNYSSRAAFKLIAIDDKFKILDGIESVVDLGCAPGSWCEVLSKKIKIKTIVGIDRLFCNLPSNVDFYQLDISDHEQVREKMKNYSHKFDLVLSDIAPNITGIGDIDQENFKTVADSILAFCKVYLCFRGILVMKFFIGYNLKKLQDDLSVVFTSVSAFKPDSSRQKSSEVYLVCIDYQNQ